MSRVCQKELDGWL